jgi:hypothetical protein
MNIEQKYNENEPKYNALMNELQDLFEDEQQPNFGNGEGTGNEDGTQPKAGNGNDAGTNDDTDDNTMDGNDDGTTGEGSDATSGSGSPKPLEELSDRQKKQLAKALAKQQEFQEGKTRKTKMSKKDKSLLEGIANSDASVEDVALHGANGGTTQVVVIRKINKLNRGVCDMYNTYKSNYYGIDEDVIKNGFRLGTMLGKKLRVRNDDVTTQYNRQRRGGIDRRLLAELGVGNTKIFEKSFTTTANDAGIHISIDASGSMGGTRFQNAMTTAIAIAKAADMVGGIRVRIDIRSNTSAPGLTKQNYAPVVLVVYDSKTNNMTHIKNNWPYLSCGGGTPEGLCFAAIKDIITQGGRNTDRYFINMSDGAPCSSAVSVTKKMVKDFKATGLKVLSYFIGESNPSDYTTNMFDDMYGTDSTEYIDTKNIVQIAKTLNKLLSERG